jgi:hypothetical protein
MAKKTGKRATKRHGAAAKRSPVKQERSPVKKQRSPVKKPAAPAAAATPSATTPSAAAAPAAAAAASRRFVDDLQIRGEAAEPDKNGKLPLQATHAIKKRNPDGSVEVQRVRLKYV